MRPLGLLGYLRRRECAFGKHSFDPRAQDAAQDARRHRLGLYRRFDMQRSPVARLARFSLQVVMVDMIGVYPDAREVQRNPLD